MRPYTLKYAEFYITNVCNLACPGCNRFNNYKFKGFQRWHDYQEQYEKWAELINIEAIGILGGEPLLNVDFVQWLNGIRRLWPRVFVKVVTNGFYLNRVPDLYDNFKNKKNLELWVGIHNPDHQTLINQELDKFLVQPIKRTLHNDDPYQAYELLVDANGVTVKLEYNWWFHQGALIQNQDNTFSLHNSDVQQAHDICHMKTCHHFIKGKLYKCGIVALLPEFVEQNKFQISDEDMDLLHSYQPLTLEHSEQQKKHFIDHLGDAIPQCKFCPSQYHGQQIAAQEKKMIFVK